MTPENISLDKPLEFGSGIILKHLDDKIIISAEQKTRIREGKFLLEGHEVILEAGPGVKISSRYPNVLVISFDSLKMQEDLYDMRKEMDERLKTIEGIFVKLVKESKK